VLRTITLTASMATVTITMLMAGVPAVSGKEPAIGLQMLVIGSGGKNVLEISGTTRPPVISRGMIKISPKLCEGGYRLVVTFPELRGLQFNATATVHGARLDGQPRPCPFFRLPRRGLRSLKVLVTINDKKLMTVNARPRTRAGETFNRLTVVKRPRYYIEALLPGRAELRVHARYRTGRVYVVTSLADISIRPGGQVAR
jgi:hypothetical protein